MRFYVLGVALLVSACGQTAPSPEPEPRQEATEKPIQQAAVKPMADADYVRVCRGGSAFRNGNPVKIIKGAMADDGLVRIDYTRDDGKHFAYDCQIDGNEIRYRMIDERGPGTGPGAWSGRASKTTFAMSGDEVTYVDDFFDGSKDTATIKP